MLLKEQYSYGEEIMQMFFIWSESAAKWRKPHNEGLTENFAEAGTFITKKAVQICAHANRFKFSERMIPISLLDNIRSDRTKVGKDFEEYRQHNLKIKDNGKAFFRRVEDHCISIEEAKGFLDILIGGDLDTPQKYILQQAIEKLEEREFKLDKSKA